MKIFQEFYCTKSGGGCGGHILVKLNTSINGVVEVVCPKCKHAHQRCIDNGEIKEQGRHVGKPKETIEPTLAAYSEKPRLRRNEINERDGVIPKVREDFLDERILEIHGDRLT